MLLTVALYTLGWDDTDSGNRGDVAVVVTIALAVLAVGGSEIDAGVWPGERLG